MTLLAYLGTARLQHYIEVPCDLEHPQFPLKNLPQWGAVEEPVAVSPVGHWLVDSFIPQSLIQQPLLSAFSVSALSLAWDHNCGQEILSPCLHGDYSLEQCCPTGLSVIVQMSYICTSSWWPLATCGS